MSGRGRFQVGSHWNSLGETYLPKWCLPPCALPAAHMWVCVYKDPCPVCMWVSLDYDAFWTSSTTFFSWHQHEGARKQAEIRQEFLGNLLGFFLKQHYSAKCSSSVLLEIRMKKLAASKAGNWWYENWKMVDKCSKNMQSFSNKGKNKCQSILVSV